ncbi:heavy metal translocating P-type ATPase [Xylanimonas cellulosilytica DSM 15894]|uniref:Cation-transporting P-type ATPase B n=1 Tax=Xylanimonas cellulosilytica (strain DSM 15894 / JCM 12276 / CECT 5975 / KCTC 9989 / LMG 20990 / NBRC 107835 / XIL07) TaxID=446471 RepID=D1C0Q6_XYLCX|nr:heavy metal translocating P-type ATPase [Xylanimonas cellulosilytica]ACZ32259.1 heavy metal translocating P-type ATPase [Xylanimonas cellulosilytica DSM 15894]
MSTDTDTPVREVDLDVTGMTCASCVARVERKLQKLPGVIATVNLPLESAHVVLTTDVDDDALVAAVESAGYGAAVTGSRVPGGHRPEAAPPAVREATSAAHAHAEPATTEPSTGEPSAEEPEPEPFDGGPHAGHHGYAGDIDLRGHDLRRRLVVAAVLSVPVVAISMVMPLQFPGWGWVVGALALPVATWAGWPFHLAAFKAARHGTSTMDTLVSIGVIAATLWSFVELSLGRMHGVYFEVAVVVVTFLLAGRWAEHRSRRRAGDALRTLLALGAKEAERVTLTGSGEPVRRADGAWDTTLVAVEDLHVGDVFTVRPGATVATDGSVVDGSSAVDTSLVTGEPVPVDVTVGDAVVGGTVNTAGHLLVRATRVGAETTLARIGRLVAQAQTGKAPIARLSDRISAVFVPIVLVLAILTLAGWLIATGDVEHAFMAAVAVLIIACPCALGLATPTAILVGTGRGAQLGVLIKGPEVLERTRTIDTVVLDKTGTVTEGRMVLERVTPSAGVDAAEALAYASAVEALSEHPIAQAIAAARPTASPAELSERGKHGDLRGSDTADALADIGLSEGGKGGDLRASDTADALVGLSERGEGEGLRASDKATGGDGDGAGAGGASAAGGLEVSGFRAVPGGGVEGVVRVAHSGLSPAGALNSRRVVVGRVTWLAAQGISVDDDVAAAVERAETGGATTVVVAWDGAARAVLELRDPAKPTSAQAVAELRALGLRPVLLTGDGEGAARAAAAAVGIDPDDVVARVLPEEKAAAVTRLQGEGRVVAMVGDGINDAAALASADLGLAMGTGTDVAMEASDITLVRGDLRAAASAVRLSRQTLRVIKQNLFWAFAYNVAAIPLAAAGVLNPMIAGGAMAASSVLVVANSLRLRRAG